MCRCLSTRPASEYLFILMMLLLASGYVLMIASMMEATRAPAGTAHVQWYHAVALLLQTIAFWPFTLLLEQQSTENSILADPTDVARQQCKNSSGIGLIALLGGGGFLLAVFWAFWDWFDPRLTQLYQQQQNNNTIVPISSPVQLSNTPGVLYLCASGCLLLALIVRWMHMTSHEDERRNASHQEEMGMLTSSK